MRDYPVIVGVGRLTQRKPASIEDAHSPISFMEAVSRMAAEDAGCIDPALVLKGLEAVGTVRMQLELYVNGGRLPDANTKVFLATGCLLRQPILFLPILILSRCVTGLSPFSHTYTIF